ncbi:MAG: amino acid adenylation domain-containing protein, partial [Rhodobacteraceae bacterium]|nr:amino acid adenylation domain-containing protein [Paracoccaceae bacterium]
MSISPSSAGDRETILLPKLAALIADLSGEDIGPDQADVSFLEFGFDSLFLGQVSQAINRDFGVTIPFRRLLSDVSTLTALSGHLAQEMPADADIFAQAAPVVEAPAAAPAPTPAQPQIANVATAPALPTAVAPIGAGLEGVMQAQLQTMQAIFAQQLQSVGGVSVAAPAPASVAPVAAAPAPAPTAAPAPVTKDAPAKAPIKFGRGPAIASGFFTDAQQALIDDLVLAYSDKFAKSKAHADAHRKIHADPRTVSAFSQDWKELVFPVVSDTAKGAYLHDIDGNDFVDLVNGFGQTAFGHSPDFVTDAVTAQMGRGFPIGPQSDRAGPIAEKFARVVGHERVTFCNTGSEAVMAAMRVARAVTGRETIVIFDKDYHGQFDEVLVKGRPNGQPGKGLPIAPGIPKSAVGNMMVLPYGTDEALNWVRDNVKDVAAVIVEPVQSRHPTLRPQEFVSELRQITRDAGVALVMDEVVTGFRVGAQGMQGAWGIQGDMATYGKVVGGGMPIGVLAGTARFMDALDGGQWQFGDDSAPETIPTFFAGTFVRHPLVLAAVDATLDHLADNGATLWEGTANRAEGLVADMKAALSARGMPDIVEAYSSWFVLKASENDPFAALLYPLMRLQGVHLLDGFCGFLTTEHGAEECAKVLTAFENALDILAAAGVFGMEPRGAASLMDLDAAKNDALIPLTESQMEIWLRHQLGGDAAAAFNESATLEMTGALDVPALKRACAALVARHDALRMVFAKDGSGFTCVEAARDVVEDHDLTTSSATLETFIDADVTRPIDITLDTPARISLARIAPDHHALVLTAHHIAADGWSFGVFFEELTALYAQETGETAANLPAAPSFARYARTRNANAAAQDQALAYWTAEFAEVPAPVDLPLDRPRPEQKTYTGGTLVHTFEPGLLARVKKGGAKQGCTLFASTFAATQILFSRLSDAENVVLGVPYAAQQDLAQSDLMGHCVQFLPIQAPIAPEATVANHMAQARDKVMTAFDNAGTTFGAIVQALKPKVEQGRVPLTEIEFNLETRASSYALPGLAAEFRGNPKKCVNFDVFFNLVETPDGLLLETHYNADLFDEETVQGWVTAYEATLNAMMENPACAIADLPIWPEAAPVVETPEPETGRVITLSDIYDRNATLWDVLAPNMAKHKSDIAVADMVSHITYGELDRTVASLAHHIQQSVPEPSARIAVCVPRGIEMLVSLLAVSRAGYTYVPLDPNQPPARLREIVEASKVSAILAMDPADVAFADDLSIIDMAAAERGEEPEPRAVNPEDPAYVIFTSGSTGTPKGVEIPHRALVNFLTSMSRAPGLTQKDRLLAVTTVMFDIAALELYLPLFVGGTVEIARTEHVVDAFKLAKRLAKGDITCMQATPTLWDMAISAGFTAPEGFKMLCGGEPLPRDLADKLVADGGTLWNMYGPTETTIWSALKNVQAGHAITIGAPIANTQLHILGKDDRAVAPGQTGELNIGGDGLALGYFGRTDLTAKAFRDVTLQGETTKLYKTGDLARMLPNGEIEVLGRIDTQVKLRGYRIELGEIESKLRALPEIDKAAVALRENQAGDKSLVGYLVAKPGADLRTTSVAQKLADNLPDYMVPRGWMVLEALPQTANGKLDRKALPDPKAMGTVTRLHDHVAPATPTETQIAAIWQEVLGQDEIGTKDTIFALGADSLSIFRIAARMLEEGLNLEARHIIAHPTIADLATFHDDRAKDGTAPARPSIV